MTSGKSSRDRQSRIQQQRALRERQRRSERRRNFAIVGTATVVALGLVIGAGLIATREQAAKDELRTADIAELKTYEDLSQNHVATPVTYPQTPPVGGDHAQVWAPCTGIVYPDPVPNERAVHSLEHGAVWVTYADGVTDKNRDVLAAKVKGKPYTLMSPHPEQSSPIVLTAWGTQLAVDEPDDPRVDRFLAQFPQGEQTPEPGATCSPPPGAG